MMRAMTTTFREFIGEFVYVYLDDIVIFSNSYEEHVTHLEKVCEALKSQSFQIREDKCQLFRKEINILGRVVKNGKVFVNDGHINKIKDFHTPKNKKQLQKFLGVINYVAPHLMHNSTIAAPLYDMTGKTSEWSWEPIHMQTFTRLKSLADEAISLTPFDPQQIASGKRRLFLITDASHVGIGPHSVMGPLSRTHHTTYAHSTAKSSIPPK